MSDWDDFHREQSSITAHMLGAADYFDEHPEWATDERLAKAFREHVAMMRAVPMPD